MAVIRKTIGIALLVLASAKLIGIIVMVTSEAPDAATSWYVKQLVYVGALAFFGVPLLRSGKADDTGHERSEEE